MYSRTVYFDVNIDLIALPAHLADCLRRLDARAVEVVKNRVSFTGGFFRLVNNWNVLVPFGFGDLTIDSNARHITYRLSFRQLVIYATVGVAIIAGFILYASYASPSWGAVLLIPGMWIWLVGGNLFIGIRRFENFLRRAIATAPRLTR